MRSLTIQAWCLYRFLSLINPGERMRRQRKDLEASLEGIRHLLSHLHGEVTALEASYAQVLSVLRTFSHEAMTDELSGLLRRRPFFAKWQELLAECQKVNESCGLLLIDIDHFKIVNETHGQKTGDEVIQRISQMLRQYESPHCFMGRYGGEEFVVALRGTDAELLGMAEMLRRGAERTHGTAESGVIWKCTVSVGMASAQREGYDATRLLEAADRALVDAKHKGRNQVRAA